MWQYQDIFQDRLEQGQNGKKGCFGDREFPTKPGQENLFFHLHRFSV